MSLQLFGLHGTVVNAGGTARAVQRSALSSLQLPRPHAYLDRPQIRHYILLHGSCLLRDMSCCTDHVDFMGRLSMDEVRRLSSTDAAQRAHIIGGFRRAMEASSSEGPAGGQSTLRPVSAKRCLSQHDVTWPAGNEGTPLLEGALTYGCKTHVGHMLAAGV